MLAVIRTHLKLSPEQKKMIPPLFRHLDKRLTRSKAKYIKVIKIT